MRALLILVLCAGCPAKKGENNDPYRNVTPQKIKDKVENIQKQEDERNDKKLEEMK